MAAITFLNPGLKDKVRFVIPPGSRSTLLKYDSDVLKDMPPLWRLACQYQVKDEDILVAF